MKILAIETSCDDTCIAVLEIRNLKLEILSNVVSSQVKLHAPYGGVYPTLAKREHQRNLPIVLEKALKKAGFKISNFQFLISKQIPNSKFQIPKIDFIAVTVGPGLEPCLWAGINFAKELARNCSLPLVPVNHIEAHILANFINWSRTPIKFPALCLVISGGHTQLILMKGIGKYKILGATRDDAAGECFDKTARILGLPYPGGPAIAAKAVTYRGRASVRLPRPMMHTKDYDFSFSGLKTAVLYEVRKLKNINQKLKTEFCYEIQQAIIDVLMHKTLKAAKDFGAKTIILGGGVASNTELRKQFNQKLKLKTINYKLELLLPPKVLCTDNAAMVAAAAYFHRKDKISPNKIEANANLRI